MRTTDTKTILSHSDTWIGLGLLAIGGSAAEMAWGFDALSRGYPFMLSLLVALAGAGLVLKVIVAAPKSAKFGLASKVAAMACALMALWILALSWGFGFVLPTLLSQTAFLLLCGLRPALKAAVFAALITGAGYAVFVLVLGVRLPDTIVPWLY